MKGENSMINNPYTILEIDESATEQEIKDATMVQIRKYCRKEENGADEEYLKKIFFQAARKLLNPEKRAEIDAELREERSKNELVPVITETSLVKMEGDEVSIIVDEHKIKFFNTGILLKNLKLDRSRFYERKIDLSNIRAIIGEDSSFMFTYEYVVDSPNKDEEDAWYGLENVFTGENCFGMDTIFSWEGRPYIDGQVFEVDGVKSISMMGSKFIPVDLIKNGRISISNLQKISSYMSNYFADNQQVTQAIFGEPVEETSKVYYGKPTQN